MKKFRHFDDARLLIIVAGSLAACSSGVDTPSTPQEISAPARQYVERLAPQFGDLALQRIHSIAVREALEETLRAEASRPWNARLEGGIKYADLLETTYRERDWPLYFATPSGLNERGVALAERLEAAQTDALDPGPYHVERTAALHAVLNRRPPADPPSFALLGEEAEVAVQWVANQHREDDTDVEFHLVDAMLGIGENAALSGRLGAQYERYSEAIVDDAATVAHLETRVADGALRMARDLRHFNYRRLSWAELADRGGGKQVVYDRLGETFDRLAQSDPETVVEVIDALRPPHEQYDRLLGALERYRGFREAGGWDRTAPFDVAAGLRSPRVIALRARLAAEGYLDAPGESDEVTDDLLAAIERYQETHQFRPGAPTPGFWRSLNVPVDRRIEEIELTLQRYRESYYRGERDFVFVNIPDFHAEVWSDGERQMRFRVVVGNNDRVCDRETRTWTYPNATPTQWAMLDHIMLNPWWNIPPRIFEEEIAEHADDPEWLREKEYELWSENGRIRARQRPGEQNALGRVKFIFPNEQNTYMHDTPHKEYFDYPVRAFSHGCVRVQDPLDLAAFFMTKYELGGRERLERIMELGSTIKIELDQEIPVFFEYYTVRVDDDGEARFLADPYRLYKSALADDPADVTDCTPEETESDDETAETGPDVDVPDELSADHGP